MASDTLFDVTKEPQKVRDAYGPTQFGEQALVARRLIEAGVRSSGSPGHWWDSHGQNFETHQELVLSSITSCRPSLMIWKQRGLLKNTLVVTLAEFGRTPQINASLRPGSLRLRPGARRSPAAASKAGRSSARPTRRARKSSTARSEPPSSSPDLQAVGINPEKVVHGRLSACPITEIGTEPIADVLA